jgi:hypothetical protein
LPLIGNERTKLTAAFLNGVATATVGAGAIAPLVAATYGIPGATLALVGLCWLVAGIVIHLVARWLLRRLRE